MRTGRARRRPGPAALLCAAAAAAWLSCAAGPAARGGATLSPAGPDGKVFGEFEDAGLFRGGLAALPEMRAWSEKDVRDGLSGATIQAKTSGGRKVGDRIVLADGLVAAYADGYGQYWLSLAPGTHELVGRCRGYRDSRRVVVVEPGSVQYLNFYLERR